MPSLFASIRSSRTVRRLVVWILVAIVPLQGTAAGILVALGPAHTHHAAANGAPTLEDFRRVGPSAERREFHVATWIGHFHASTAKRHYHPVSDESVDMIDDGSLVAGSDGGASNGALSLALFACMLPSLESWDGRTERSDMVSARGWPPCTHDPQPLERPPQAI